MCGLRLGKNFVMLLQHSSGAVMRLAFFSATLRIYNSSPHGYTQSIRPGAIIESCAIPSPMHIRQRRS